MQADLRAAGLPETALSTHPIRDGTVCMAVQWVTCWNLSPHLAGAIWERLEYKMLLWHQQITLSITNTASHTGQGHVFNLVEQRSGCKVHPL